MFTIKREKAGLTAYAKTVSPDGLVTAWAEEPAAAATVDHLLAGLVKGHYANRPGAGVLTLVAVDGSDEPAVPADDVDRLADSLKAAVAEVSRLRKILADRDAAVALLEEETTALKSALAAAQSSAAPPAAG